MFKINGKKLLIVLAIFLTVEILSAVGLSFPAVNQIIFGLLVLASLILTFYSLEYGLLVILAELFIGSLGHLFYLNIGGGQLTIRIALWLVLMFVFAWRFLTQIIKQKVRSAYWLSLKSFPGKKFFGVLFLFILIGLINGLIRGQAPALIFADFNAWLYFLLLLPLIVVYGDLNEDKAARLQTVFLAAVIWLGLKTLFLLFIFTHNSSWAPDIYYWLRKTLVGEMTPTTGGWPRIFIQGQIFSAIAFFLVFWSGLARFKFKEFFCRKNLWPLFAAALFLSSVLISFSRSFWVGLLVALFFSLILVWRLYSFKKAITAAGWLAGVAVLGFLLIYLTVDFPYWRTNSGNLSSVFLERVKSDNEPALASRWSLLPILMKEIKKEPFFGQGYGATVTYFSRDPRILQNSPTGEYKTYAFEWGYLDIWLKLGIFGLLAYLFLLFKLLATGLKAGFKHNNYIYFGLSAGLVFIAVTHTFTPYLNHPLGIGFLVVSSCLIWSDRVY